MNFMRQAQQEYNKALSEEKYVNDATQDLLHTLELCDNSCHDKARISEALRQVRRERRIAKDKSLQFQPAADWIVKNNKTINGLEQLRGEVRKAEKNTENRYYNPKTDILEQILRKK